MDILAIIAANGVAVCVVGWLLKLWVDKRLSHSLSQVLENYKSELAKEVSLHTIRHTWIHNKKVELLSELYMSMLDADIELKTLFMDIKVKNQESVILRADNFAKKYTELNSCLHKNELFLEQSLINDIRNAYKPFFDIALHTMEEDVDFEGLADALPNSLKEIIEIGDSPRSKLVNKFRAALGIDFS
ncbi:hypothetical protein [Legionella drancourtii]|uniref:Uncharacterized protein n=1 Tax=Legionella drancourtii LLAP12 TaxID=658187 RepID=G9ELF1_9GAMM|nr:hypothetical protein [Legionella drancourtii]EHL31786.1 hypothetical protein LDG_5949 [Legionella drancourtii LLAP12]